MQELIYCKNCKEDVEPFTSEQVFSNGTTHIRGDCPTCGVYLKYLPQYLKKIDEIIPETKIGKTVIGKRIKCKRCGGEAIIILEDNRYKVRCYCCQNESYLKEYNLTKE